MRNVPPTIRVLLFAIGLLCGLTIAPMERVMAQPGNFYIPLPDRTMGNTPPNWWTARADVPWVDDTHLDGRKALVSPVTLPNGRVVPVGTIMRWRRLRPGYDVDVTKWYSEEKDVHFRRLHPEGATHKYSGDGPYGENQLRIGTVGRWANLNPILLQDSASSDIAYFTFNRLVDIDADWQPVPQLAEGYTISPDGLEYTFYLRPDCRFSDGTPITASDVEFTYASILDENVLSPRKGDFVALDSIEVHDPLTLTFHLKLPYAAFERGNLTYGILPRAQFDLEENRDMNSADFNHYPIGGGPYVLDHMEGDDVYLSRNPNYFGRQPAIASILFKKTPGQELEQMMLEHDEIDVGSILMPNLDAVGVEHPEIRENRTALALGYSYLGFNHKSTFFKDLKVRQAVAHAIDREAMVEHVINGNGQIINANIPPMSPFYTPDVTSYDFNPTEAKRLLAEAGWKDTDGDGLIQKDGRTFKFELITNEGNPQRQKMVELIAADLRKVGILVTPRQIEWSSFIEQFIHQHNFEAFVLAWSLAVDPDDFTIFHSTQFEDGLNYGYYSNPEVDRLLEKGQVTTDDATRLEVYRKVQRELSRDLPYVFLFCNKKSGGISKRVMGVPQIEPNDVSYLVPPNSAATWWIKGFPFTDDGPVAP